MRQITAKCYERAKLHDVGGKATVKGAKQDSLTGCNDLWQQHDGKRITNGWQRSLATKIGRYDTVNLIGSEFCFVCFENMNEHILLLSRLN